MQFGGQETGQRYQVENRKGHFPTFVNLEVIMYCTVLCNITVVMLVIISFECFEANQ